MTGPTSKASAGNATSEATSKILTAIQHGTDPDKLFHLGLFKNFPAFVMKYQRMEEALRKLDTSVREQWPSPNHNAAIDDCRRALAYDPLQP